MDVQDLTAATTVVVTVLRAIPAHDWDRSTPCPDWTVRQLVHHLVVGTDRFATRLGRETTTTTTVPPADASGDELIRALEASTVEFVDVIQQPGSLPKIIELPIGPVPGQSALDLRVTETITHGWDLSHALGRPFAFDPEAVERAIAFSATALESVPEREVRFGTPRPVAEGANAQDRLAALLGRQPVRSS